MRTAGTLLSILALVAFQTPWIACACDGEASFTPVLTGAIAHDESGHEDDHEHHCCDHVAHAVHGAEHAHGRHCHGTFAHSHEDDEPSERHEGFRLDLRTLPGAVTLDDPTPTPAPFVALLDDAPWHVLAQRTLSIEPEPPERPAIPVAATERLLL